MSSISAPPASVAIGGTFSVTDTTTNDGNLAAGGSVTGYYLAHSNSVFTRVGWRVVPGLGIGQSSTSSDQVTVPLTTAPGTYYLAACANRTQSAVESNLTNDCRRATTQVQVTAAFTPTATPTTMP